MKKTILIALLLFGFITNLFAYPISPRPLRKLVIESEYIIIGQVIKVYDKKDKDDYGLQVAQIKISENLQGEIKTNIIEIEFEANMICPSPDRYFENTYVISFLDKEKKSGKFRTHALSYGAKTLKLEEIDIYKKRITEIQDILKMKNTVQQKLKTVEWLIKCAENEVTRWEGTFELRPESNFISFYSEDKKQDFEKLINQEQKERLKKALLNSSESIDFGLVDIVYKNNEVLIDDFLLSKLKKLNADEFWIAREFIQRLKHKNTSLEMNKLLEDYEKIEFDYEKEQELKTIITNFIQLIEK